MTCQAACSWKPVCRPVSAGTLSNGILPQEDEGISSVVISACTDFLAYRIVGLRPSSIDWLNQAMPVHSFASV